MRTWGKKGKKLGKESKHFPHAWDEGEQGFMVAVPGMVSGAGSTKTLWKT